MSEEFSLKDISDPGGYTLRADHILDLVNTRITRLEKERDEARELVKLSAQTMQTHSLLLQCSLKEWGVK